MIILFGAIVETVCVIPMSSYNGCLIDGRNNLQVDGYLRHD
jgi:hypothetical protein